MLTMNQCERVELALKLLKELEAPGDEASKAILLGVATTLCSEALKEDLLFVYTHKNEEWYSPDSIKESLQPPTISSLVSVFIKGMFIQALKTSVVCAGLSACLSLGYWGTSEIFNTNLRIESELKSQSRSCLGASAIFSSVAAGSIVLAALVAREGE